MVAEVEWVIKGRHLVYCPCAYGCPCDFSAPPTYGSCEGVVGVSIDEGHFGEVRLDGLAYAATFHFPGPLHEGNGTMQAIVDERADEQQRTALLTILSGKGQPEGTLFQIFSVIAPNVLKPLFLPVTFTFDYEGRRGSIVIPGLVEAVTEPIKNPVTGAAHRALIRLPEGFEYREAECASGRAKGTGEIEFDFSGRHSSLSFVAWNQGGMM